MGVVLAEPVGLHGAGQPEGHEVRDGRDEVELRRLEGLVVPVAFDHEDAVRRAFVPQRGARGQPPAMVRARRLDEQERVVERGRGAPQGLLERAGVAEMGAHAQALVVVQHGDGRAPQGQGSLDGTEHASRRTSASSSDASTRPTSRRTCA